MPNRRDLGLLVLRVGVGATIAAHGLPKLFGGPGRKPPEQLSRILGGNYAKGWESGGPEAFAGNLAKLGVPFPQLAARASGVAELGGGMALALGAATPLAATVVVANMMVAISRAHWQTGFYGQGGYEFPSTIAVGAAALGLTGPGAISVDGLLH